jgi:hypothetical protein
MTLKAIEANELKALPWNEIQKMHRTLKLRQGSGGGKRADYERRILTYFTRRNELLWQEPTGVTCAICPLAKHLDGNRYCCVTNTVTRGHWEATTDCLEAIAESESETAVAEAEAPIASTKNPPSIEVESAIEPIEIQAQEPLLLTPRAPYGWKFHRHSSGERNLSYWIKEWESVKFQNLPADIIVQYKFTVAEIQFLESASESASDSVLDLGDNEYDRYLKSQNIREYVGTHS